MINANSRRASGPRTLRNQSQLLVRDVKELGAIAVDNVESGAEQMKERGMELLATGRETVARYGGEVKKYIVANPFRSLLVAVGVGTLVGLMLRRRS